MKEKVDTINLMLRKAKLKIPSFRNEVTASGKNVHWLLKNLPRNNNVPPELIELLNNFWG